MPDETADAPDAPGGARFPDPGALLEAIKPELDRVFKPALLARLTVVPYYPLAPSTLADIVRLQAERDCVRLVKHDDTLTVKHDRTVTVTNNRTATVEEGDDTLTVKQGNRSVVLDAGDHVLHLKAGDQTTGLDAGKSTLEAMQSIELKVGPSRILIDASGVRSKAPR